MSTVNVYKGIRAYVKLIVSIMEINIKGLSTTIT